MSGPKYNGLCPGCGFPLHPGTPCRHGGILWSPDYKSELPKNAKTILAPAKDEGLIRLDKTIDSLQEENENLRKLVDSLLEILSKLIEGEDVLLTPEELKFSQDLIRSQHEKSKNKS